MEKRKIIIVSSDGSVRPGNLASRATQLPVVLKQPIRVAANVPEWNTIAVPQSHDYIGKSEPEEECFNPPHKKARGDIPSNEDKSLRRKMKNRESAQTARDKKKQYLESLEQRVKELEEEKLTLRQAKQFVDNRCAQLEYENQCLRSDLQKMQSSTTVLKSDPDIQDYNWKQTCQKLMQDNEALSARVEQLEESLNWRASAGVDVGSVHNESLECLVPIDSEVTTVPGHEESSESAALVVSPQQNRFLHALVVMISMLLASTKFRIVSEESTTLLEHALIQTQRHSLKQEPYRGLICPLDKQPESPDLKDQLVITEPP